MTYSNVTRFRNAAAALEHRLEIVLLLDRHDREALGRGRRMERDREAELLRPPANAAMPGRMPTVETVMCRAPMPSPSGALRIVSAVSTAGQLSSGSPMPMNTTLVGLSSGSAQHDLAHLARDLERREVPPEAHPAGGAEGAAQGAAGLRARCRACGGRRTGSAPISIASPSASRQRILPGAVGQTARMTSGSRRGRGCSRSSAARSVQRQLGGLCPAIDRGDPEPPRDLLGPIAGQPPVRRPGREARRARRRVQEIGGGVSPVIGERSARNSRWISHCRTSERRLRLSHASRPCPCC